MAIAIIITAGVAIVNMYNSSKRQRYEFARQLYEQFQTFHLELWQTYSTLSRKKYKSFEEIKKDNNEIERESKALIIFLAKIGLLIRKKILKFDEVDMYFHQYISNKEDIENLIINLSIIQKTVPGYLYRNLEYLFYISGRVYGISAYKNIITNNFEFTMDLTKVEFEPVKIFKKKIKFWKKDYYKEMD